MKTKLLLIAGILFFILLFLLYIRIFLFSANTTRLRRISQQISGSFAEFRDRPDVFSFPENILSERGEPLLSWRVAFLLEREEYYHPKISLWRENEPTFRINESWQSTNNEEAAKTKPNFCFYPYYLDSKINTMTCLVRIKEIAEFKKANPDSIILGKKALLIIVDPKFAVPWTSPRDISWKDLASGKVKPYMELGAICYARASDYAFFSDNNYPKTFSEWQNFCGVSEQVTQINLLENESLLINDETVLIQPISSAPKPQVSDAISGENPESDRFDTTKSVDSLDEK